MTRPWRARAVSTAVLLVLTAGCAGQPGHVGDDIVSDSGGGDSPHADARGRVGFPLAGPPPNGFATKKDVGEVFTNGQLVVFNAGSHDIQLVSVTPELTGHGLRYLGARVAGLGRKLGSTQDEPSYPPREPLLGTLRPVEGLVLHPGRTQDRRGVELLLGFRVVGPGRSTVRSVRVVYRYDGQQRDQRWTSTMAVCAPRAGTGACAQEYGGTTFG